MKNTTKTLMGYVAVMTIILLVSSTAAMAQIGSNGILGMLQYPAFLQQPLAVPTVSQTTGDLLIDNFEYFDSPYNHGWVQVEPPYPVYGYGLGYATIFNTVLDLAEGSRVLDVYRPSSVFLIGTPYERHAIRYPCSGCLNVTLGRGTNQYPIFSFKFRAPLGIESWDIFEMRLYLGCPATRYISITPLQGPCPNCIGPYFVQCDAQGNIQIQIGREFLDGSWHVIWLDLVQLAQDFCNIDLTGTVVGSIDASGQMFRLDDVAFRKADQWLCEPYLFKIGPRYAQFYEPYAFLFFADQREYNCGAAGLNLTDMLLLDANGDLPNVPGYGGPADLFETDPNAIRAYWVAQGANTDYGYFDPNSATYGQPDPGISQLLGRSIIINPTLPIFADPNVRWSSANGIQHPLYQQGVLGNQSYQWNATVGGIGANGVQFQGVAPLAINPYDGMPTYIPVYGPEKAYVTSSIFGGPYYPPQYVSALEAALYNAGFSVWPGIAVLNFTPYVFEDIILTLEVTDGRTSDYETFPIEVVNYPVENYPPYIEDVDDQFFATKQPGVYALSVIDPDCTMFSTALTQAGTAPATTHVPMYLGNYRMDLESITYSMTLNGLPSYQYGPWMNSLIDAKRGIVSFTPQFEGAYDAVVVATDSRGASSIAQFTIFTTMPGTWLNHPPIVLMDWDHPQTVRAGEEFVLTTPTFKVIDPDGDQLYFSCNIGAMGRKSDGSPMWTFTSNFPGYYTAEIIAYDIRGGYAIITVDVEVKPWWGF